MVSSRFHRDMREFIHRVFKPITTARLQVMAKRSDLYSWEDRWVGSDVEFMFWLTHVEVVFQASTNSSLRLDVSKGGGSSRVNV